MFSVFLHPDKTEKEHRSHKNIHVCLVFLLKDELIFTPSTLCEESDVSSEPLVFSFMPS